MNNHALKLVKEKASVSLKVHDLVKMPEDEFHNIKKQSLYEQAKYYHKTQKGILRISKYEFYSTKENRNSMLKKHDIEFSLNSHPFDYAESESADTKVWYMHFADRYAFLNRDTKTFGFEDIQIMNMPLLYKACKYILRDSYSCITPSTFYDDSGFHIPTPLLFEHVPQWYNIKNTEELEKNKPILTEKYNNIISMVAPFGIKNAYTERDLYFLCKTLIAGYGGIIEQGKKSKISRIELHTGNWGCGNALNNNKELMYLAQMIAASVMGFKKLVFHGVSVTDYENALKKYNLLVDEFSFEQLVAYLLLQEYKKD